MEEYMVFIIIWVIIWFFVGYMIWKIIKYKELKRERAFSVKRSRSVILWEVYEKVAPFLPNFPYNPKDMIFVWKGVDYVIFDGLSAGNLKQVIFLEIKSGKSNLNKNERNIRDTVWKKKVFYQIYRI